MQFLAVGLIWGGYTLVWWGWCHVTGPRNGADMTFGMLIKPGSVSQAESWLNLPKPSAAASAPQGNITNPSPATSPSTAAQGQAQAQAGSNGGGTGNSPGVNGIPYLVPNITPSGGIPPETGVLA